jgi:predicted RNA-binding protein with PUA-like domain
LLKTEPSAYSFDQLERDRRTTWDGVKNAVALKHLRAITRGDRLLVYHTGDEKAVIGLAEAVSDAYPDPKVKGARAVVIDLEARKRLPRPVTLAELKAIPALATFPLVRLPRLSVMPVSAAEWREIERLAKTAAPQ